MGIAFSQTGWHSGVGVRGSGGHSGLRVHRSAPPPPRAQDIRPPVAPAAPLPSVLWYASLMFDGALFGATHSGLAQQLQNEDDQKLPISAFALVVSQLVIVVAVHLMYSTIPTFGNPAVVLRNATLNASNVTPAVNGTNATHHQKAEQGPRAAGADPDTAPGPGARDEPAVNAPERAGASPVTGDGNEGSASAAEGEPAVPLPVTADDGERPVAAAEDTPAAPGPAPAGETAGTRGDGDAVGVVDMYRNAANNPITRACGFMFAILFLTFSGGAGFARGVWARRVFEAELQDEADKEKRLLKVLIAGEVAGGTAAVLFAGFPLLLHNSSALVAWLWHTAYMLLHGAYQGSLLWLMFKAGEVPGVCLHPKLVCTATALVLHVLCVLAAPVGLALPSTEWLALYHIWGWSFLWSAQEFWHDSFTVLHINPMLQLSANPDARPRAAEGPEPAPAPAPERSEPETLYSKPAGPERPPGASGSSEPTPFPGFSAFLGPKEAEALEKQFGQSAETPDGRTVMFPDGFDPQEIMRQLDAAKKMQ